MIFGTGFPPFRGGVLRYADALGPARVVAALEDLASRRGTRFQPAAILIEMARSGANFYSGGKAGESPEDS
jgi:3-hydroxyacyl-CoA dehydrogenase/enoyl-CoA hydratase/3-hydroxybutyryl-CoA epimerase